MTMNASQSAGAARMNQRILLVDDHVLMRKGLIELINGESGLEVCGEAGNLGEACEQASRLKPDLVIVDISLDGNDGVELTKELSRRWPDLPILAYSMHEEEIYAERVLRAGAKGYVMKRHSPEMLLEAIEQILRGKVFLSDRMSERMLGKIMRTGEPPEETSPIDKLSDRELEVFRLIGQGMSTNQIAEKLCLSVKTIETYREHLKQKLNLKSGLELMRRAVEWAVQRPQA
ncbi:MAG TPA: response regulator transcription factor [Tepidisphaeraceae bacterium]|nr:response regulator transcription factor [Tepidisphaeraceae bacterium]